MIQLPEHPLPVKPAFESPCNGCGLCCALELCKAAQLSHYADGTTPAVPCRWLHFAQDRTYCKLVMEETRHNMEPVLSNTLLIGHGCTMPDELVTETEMDRIIHKEYGIRKG